jgi:2-haloalkanoic acid dehalogenase type II
VIGSAVVFDYYETLVELSNSTRVRFFDDLARRVGVDLSPGEAYGHWRERIVNDRTVRLAGMRRPPSDGPTPPFVSFRDTWLKRFCELFRLWGVDVPAELGADAFAEAHGDALVYPDVPPALAILRDRCQLAVLSDADRGFLEASVRRNDLAFEVIVTSDEVRAYKPHISMFRTVCDRLGVGPEATVYVGDGPWQDVEGARNAGMTAVWMNRSGGPWPEDVDPPPAEVASLTELVDLLQDGRVP